MSLKSVYVSGREIWGEDVTPDGQSSLLLHEAIVRLGGPHGVSFVPVDANWEAKEFVVPNPDLVYELGEKSVNMYKRVVQELSAQASGIALATTLPAVKK